MLQLLRKLLATRIGDLRHQISLATLPSTTALTRRKHRRKGMFLFHENAPKGAERAFSNE